MNILILKASGNRRGSSAMLADEFARGARDAGHTVTEYNLIGKKIGDCIGCGRCGMAGACVQKDDYEDELKGLIRTTDMLVFAFPVYYYSWPSQAKAVIDRFYSFTYELTGMRKKAIMLTVAWDSTPESFEIVEAYYDRICSYMHFQDCGRVVGIGCGTPDMTRTTDYPAQAYRLGVSL
ncbi:flavodoxin family protein [Curtanaerobium respiraculi]|uniref:flavodoxin family protein n=1 Tax=Curtanaerobium respiraculi TaxID=2949669 RepID=UPI0024B3856E|nr:flavodoxin family protein [Curtanaerobium respiraculi]